MTVGVNSLLVQTQPPEIEGLDFPDSETNAGADSLFALGFRALLTSLLNPSSQTATGLSNGPTRLAGKPARAPHRQNQAATAILLAGKPARAPHRQNQTATAVLLASKPASAFPVIPGGIKSGELFSDLEMLASPLAKLIRSAGASGQAAGVEVKSKSTGKLAVWFDPKSKHLSILPVVPAATPTGFVTRLAQTLDENGLAQKGREKGIAAPGNQLPLAPEGQIQTRPNTEASVRLERLSKQQQAPAAQLGKTAARREVPFRVEREKASQVAAATMTRPGWSHKKGSPVSGDAKQWLRNALARKGVHVEQIDLDIKDSAGDSNGTGRAGGHRRAAVTGRGRQTAVTPPKAEPAEMKVPGKQPNDLLAKDRSTQKAGQAPGDQRQKTQSTEAASEARDDMQKLVQPGPKQAARHGSTVVHTVAEAKNSSASSALLPQGHLQQGDQPNGKPGLLVDKMKPASASMTQDDAQDGANVDQDLPDKPDSQRAADALESVPGERGSIRSRPREHLETEVNTRHLANILAPNGRPKFDLANGRLVATEAIPRSSLAEMIERITELTQNQTHFTNQKLEVQIEVEKIGKVLVDALKQVDKIHLQLHVESQEVRRLLETQLRPLVEQLAKDGIDIGKLDVSVRDQRPDQHARNESTPSGADSDEPGTGETLHQFRRGGQPPPRPKQLDRHPKPQAGRENRMMEVWA